MRQREFINTGHKETATLACGGPGFKLYIGAKGIWFVGKLKKQIRYIHHESGEFKIPMSYCNLKYARIVDQPSIRSAFFAWLAEQNESYARFLKLKAGEK